MPRDHIVIVGAGMGGLAAAADLARRGAQVTVLDRAAAPGGKMRQVPAGAALVDAGPTVFTMRWIFDEIFEGKVPPPANAQRLYDLLDGKR